MSRQQKIMLAVGGVVLFAAGCVCGGVLWSVVMPALGSTVVKTVGVNVPEEVKQEFITRYRFGDSTASDFKFETTGAGQPLPLETNAGVVQIVCLRMRYNGRNPSGAFSPSGPQVESLLAKRIGNAWSVEVTFKPQWDQHSCPGQYETSRR